MKSSFVLLLIVLLAQQVYAAQWLVTVDLPNRERLKAWHEAGLPANELIGSTAVAVLDESQLRTAQQRDFQVQKLELYDTKVTYLIADQRYAKNRNIGRLLWDAGVTGLYRSETRPDRIDHHGMHFLNPTPLPERFWQQVVTKQVPVKSIRRSPFIQSLVDQVDTDSISATIVRLQNFQTRLVFTDSSAAASAWLKERFSSWGLYAQFDSFYYETWPDTGYERSVIAEIPGSDTTSEVIVCGHFDSYSLVDPFTLAPGADDNASGTAGAMEIARIFRGHTWKQTMKFAAWGGEEMWMWGSGDYARRADSMNRNIKALINLDMIGYSNDAGLDVGCGYSGNANFCKWLVDLYNYAAQTYVATLTVISHPDCISDNYYFSQRGYSAIGVEEYPDAWEGGNPNYHQPTDLYGTLNPEQFTAVTKAGLATMAILDLSPNSVKDVTIRDIGDGFRLAVDWSANTESVVIGYNIYWGKVSGNYSDSCFVSGSDKVSDTLFGLTTDSTYYIVIRAVDADGFESLLATEVIGVPRAIPLAPGNVTATPLLSGINVNWAKNREMDLAGYTIYRRINSSASDSLTALCDTTYFDQPLSGANKYYYTIRAYDADGNNSLPSNEAYSRPFTLDQGILVVDETNNWTSGNFPRDAQQDSFYEYLLTGYQHEQYDFDGSAQKLGLANLGPYSTVVWHSDDPSMFLASNDSGALRQYLGHGGKLWFTGWRSAADIGNSTTYPADFAAGSLLYDCFSISHAELSGTTDSFKTAIGLRGYPDISVDTTKYPATIWGKVMRNIEAYVPAGSADTIYVMDMKNNGSAFEGRACAVRDSGRMVLFGFPLYYMNRNQARLAAQKVMAEFGEPITGVAGLSTPLEVRGLRLEQCRPNPFKHSTNINYHIPKPGMVDLSVYNIAGQRIRTLVNGAKPAGNHQIKWDGRDDSKRSLSAGIYFVRLNAEGSSQTRKLMLVR